MEYVEGSCYLDVDHRVTICNTRDARMGVRKGIGYRASVGSVRVGDQALPRLLTIGRPDGSCVGSNMVLSEEVSPRWL